MNVLQEDLEHITASLKNNFLKLKNKNVLLTGGTGFVGTWLILSFLKLNETLSLQSRLFVVSRDPERFLTLHPELKSHPSLIFISGHVSDFKYPEGSFSYVIHAATDVVKRRKDSSLSQKISLAGTKRVLLFCQEKKVTDYLYISSGAAADSHSSGSLDYGREKRESEDLSLMSASDGSLQDLTSIKIARCYALVGPYFPLDAHFAIGNFIRDVLCKRPIQVQGDGQAVRSYLYASDMVIWLWKILFRGESQGIYDVGSDQAVTMKDLAQTCSALAKHLDPDSSVAEIRVTPSVGSLAGLQVYIPSLEKAKSIGLRVSVDLEAAIRRTLQHYWV